MRQWTKEQKSAIDTRDRTLLVSAAAGSGKTATLTERIISSVLDPESPKDISKMLIVTFTNAAVSELKERITAAIKECAAKNPKDKRLEEQLLLVKDSKIMTINSFCNNILRSSAEAVGLPPNYRIAEPAEALVVAKELLEGMILSAYEGELADICSAEDFAEAVEGLVGVKNEGELSEVFTLIYDRLSSEIEGVDTLAGLIEAMNPERGVDGLPAIIYIKDALREALTEELGLMTRARDTLFSEGAKEKTLLVFDTDIANIRRALAEDSYEGIHTALAEAEHIGMTASRTESYKWAKKIRDEYLINIKKFTSDYFSLSKDDLVYLLTKICKNADIIRKFLKEYDRVFLEEKRARGMVEFRDAERYAYSMLVGEGGEPTQIAKELSLKFSDIYIDEYQDVNALQAGVFEAISRADNCFMVGDIKQSIYGFRSAKPELFSEKKKSYPTLFSEGDYPKASLFMSKNFRCDENIIDFTNGIFDKLFSAFADGIGYSPMDRLEFAKVYREGETPVGHIPEIRIVQTQKDGGADPQSPEEMLAEDLESLSLSAEAVAELVDSLVGKERLADGRLIAPSDIAILTSSVKSCESDYREALLGRGFEVEVEDGEDFFLTEEVLLALSLLNFIENPRKDVYLTAYMTSPLSEFSFDEIYAIRKEGGGDCLYSSLLEYSKKHPECEKCKALISAQKRYSEISEGMSAYKLLTLLYKETGLLTLASANGRKDNLTLLHSHARRFEKTSYRGLYSFISYIEGVIRTGGSFSKAGGEGESSDKIRMLTYHRSKGLEFPVVIMTETQKRLRVTERGAAARVKLAPEFGFSVGVRDESGLAVIKNPISAIIEKYNREKELEEELRVLYVALTRARERLYIFGSTGNLEALTEKTEFKKENFSKYAVTELSSLLEIILTCRNMGRIIYNNKPNHGDFNKSEEANESSAPVKTDEAVCSDKLISDSDTAPPQWDFDGGFTLDERFDYAYPLKYSMLVPEKLSVSELSPSVLDESDAAVPIAELNIDGAKDGMQSLLSSDFEPTLPEFISGKRERRSAEAGIATHAFMQFCDFDRLLKEGARAELSRLVEEEFLSKEDAELVRISEIERFRKSELLAEIMAAKKVYRELRFNIKLPAARFTETEEGKRELANVPVLVQGVMDCVIEAEDGSLHLVDYKTDRLTKEERDCPELSAKRLLDTHSSQLSYYALATESIFGREPSAIGIYSMHLGDEILMKQKE